LIEVTLFFHGIVSLRNKSNEEIKRKWEILKEEWRKWRELNESLIKKWEEYGSVPNIHYIINMLHRILPAPMMQSSI
jgi:ribosomal protein L32E